MESKNNDTYDLFVKQNQTHRLQKINSRLPKGKKANLEFLNQSLKVQHIESMGFPGGSNGKESACSAGDSGLIPGSGRSPGEENGNPLQYFCLENPMDRGAWQAIVYRVAKSRTQLK